MATVKTYIGNIKGKDGQTMTNYSTTETVCGTWIDGKPIYRKVIEKKDILFKNGTEIDVSDLNIGNYAVVKLVFRADDDGIQGDETATMASDGSKVVGLRVVNKTKIVVIGNVEWAVKSNRYYYFIIEYTKTTD